MIGSAHRSGGPDKPATAFLRPARNCGVIKEGYEGVYYPMYYVEQVLQYSRRMKFGKG